MRKVLLCIHGRSNKPKEETLLAWWEKSINEGLRKNCDLSLSDVRVDMAYYSDIKNGDPIPDSENPEPYKPAKRNALKEYKVGYFDRIKERAGDWLDAPMDWLEEKSAILSTFARGILKVTLEDLAAYYSDQEIRTKIQDCLKKKIDEYSGWEIILISHSMGTIVAYDVLREFGRDPNRLDFNISHFITMGSPLGLTAVQGQILKKENAKLRTPTVVKNAWVNFSDPQDIVAIDSHLQDDYKENSSGIIVQDVMVVNDYPDNEHKSYGYLRTPEFSKHLSKLI